MKIAIIDDDPVCHFLYCKLIERVSDDHQILRFHNGLEAMEYLILNAEKPDLLPDLILLDINMPTMNGWQFLEKLRLIKPSAYSPEIYLISSSTDPRDVDSAMQFPELKGFLQKPLTKTQIAQMLEDVPSAVSLTSYRVNGWPIVYNASPGSLQSLK